MSNTAQRNLQRILVGKEITTASTGKMDNLKDGEIGAFAPGGTRLVDSSAGTGEKVVSKGDKFFLAQGRASGEEPVITPVIDPNEVVRASVKEGSAEQEQVDYVGYDGDSDSGSIDPLNDNQYHITLYIQEYLTSNVDGRRVKFGHYKSDSTATQEEVALGLAKNLTANMQREAEEFMRFGAVNNAGLKASDDIDEDATFTKGSTKVGITTQGSDVDYGGSKGGDDPTNLAVGDYIRVEDDATTVTKEALVYRVESIDAGNNEFTLDRPFEKDTVTITGDDGKGTQVIASGSIGSDWGVKLEGRPLSHVVGKEYFKKVRFEKVLERFGTTDTSQKQAAKKGVGEGKEIADLEDFLQGHEGEYLRDVDPTVHPKRKLADTTIRYDLLNLIYKDSETVGFQNEISPVQITVACPDSGLTGVSNSTYFSHALGNNTDITDIIEIALPDTTPGGDESGTGDLQIQT